MRRFIFAVVSVAAFVSSIPARAAAARREHSVYLGAVRHVPYSRQGDPAGAAAGEDSLPIRALVVRAKA